VEVPDFRNVLFCPRHRRGRGVLAYNTRRCFASRKSAQRSNDGLFGIAAKAGLIM